MFADTRNACDKECSRKVCDWTGYVSAIVVIILLKQLITCYHHYNEGEGWPTEIQTLPNGGPWSRFYDANKKGLPHIPLLFSHHDDHRM